jgi:hypothetical protein
MPDTGLSSPRSACLSGFEVRAGNDVAQEVPDVMIRTVAELLSEIVGRALPELDQSEVKHGPTIGDMYEGLSVEVLRRAVPDGLGLQVVTGFATDGSGKLSAQLDCMLVRGDGKRIPYTDSYIWHVEDIVAVIEVKKSLHSTEMKDAWKKLSSVRELEIDYRKTSAEEDPSRPVDIWPAQKAFAEATGRVAWPYEKVDELSAEDQAILFTLIQEQLSIIRIVLGLHGFKSERAFREAMADLIGQNVGVEGYGPGAFPQLTISGSYSLVKANGRPYSARLVNGAWPFVFSSPVNPLLLLLEFIWTRLDELFGIPELWGDDLHVEVGRTLFKATPSCEDGRKGWHIDVVNPSEDALDAVPLEMPWSPAFVTLEEFVVLQRLCNGHTVSFADGSF